MREENVSRFVTLVGGSVGDPKDQMSLAVRIQRFVLELVASETLTDQENHVTSVRATDLDWT